MARKRVSGSGGGDGADTSDVSDDLDAAEQRRRDTVMDDDSTSDTPDTPDSGASDVPDPDPTPEPEPEPADGRTSGGRTAPTDVESSPDDSSGGGADTAPDSPPADFRPGGGRTVDPGVTDAQQQEVAANLAEEFDQVNDRQQGVELDASPADSGSVAGQASAFERDILDANPGLDADDVRIVRDGDTLRAELTPQGREELGMNPTESEQLKAVEFGTDGLGTTGTVRGRRRASRVTGAAGLGTTGLGTTGTATSRRRNRTSRAGTAASLGTTTFGSERTTASGDAARELEQRLEEQTGVELDQDDVDVERTTENGVPVYRASLSDRGQRTVAGERTPGSDLPVVGGVAAGTAETIVGIDQAVNAPWLPQEAETLMPRSLGADVPDVNIPELDLPGVDSRAVSGGGAAGLATAAVLAPEPVSTTAGAAVLGGLALTGVGYEVAKRTGTFQGPPTAQATYQDTELPVTDAGFEDGELPVADPTATDELPVSEPMQDGEINIGDAIADERTELRVPESFDESEIQITENGEVNVPASFSGNVVIQRQRERDEDDVANPDEDVIVEVPDELLPDEPVVIGDGEVTQESEQRREEIQQPDVVDESRYDDVANQQDQQAFEQADEPEVTEPDPEFQQEFDGVTPGVQPQRPGLQPVTPADLIRDRGLLEEAQRPGVGSVDDGFTDVGSDTGLALETPGALGAVGVGTGIGLAQPAVSDAVNQPALSNPALYRSDLLDESAVQYPTEVGYANQRSRTERERTPEETVFRPGDEPLTAVDGVAADPTFGYYSETAQGLVEGGFITPEAPSAEQLAALRDLDPAGDLPTQGILSGRVDIEPVQDLFRVSEVDY